MFSRQESPVQSKDYRFNIYILIFVWTFFVTLGIHTGIIAAPFSSDVLFVAITSECLLGIIIVFRLIVIISSIILSRSCRQWGLVIPVCISAVFYGYVIGITYAAWGSAAWLFSLLFYFPNTIFILTDIWLWIVLIR